MGKKERDGAAGERKAEDKRSENGQGGKWLQAQLEEEKRKNRK